MVFIPRRCAARGQDHIRRRRRLVEHMAQGRAVIGNNAHIYGLMAKLPHEPCQHGPVGIVNLPLPGGLPRLKQFIPG